MEFKIYQNGPGNVAGDTGGTLLWTEDWVYGVNSPDNRVIVKNGYFSVNLGSICPMTATTCTASTGNSQTNTIVNFDQSTLWLSMNVGNTSTAATFSAASGDGEMLPMKRMASSVYALQAANSDNLGGIAATGFIQNDVPGVLQQSNANINILSAATTDVGAQIQAAVSGSAAILDLKQNTSSTSDFLDLLSTGSTVASINSSGNLYVAGSVDTQTGTGLTIGGANATTIAIGNTSATAQTISVGTNAAANTINIGTGALSSGSDTIAIGTGSTSSGKDLVTVGSANGASQLTLNAGSAGIGLTATSGTVTVKSGSATAAYLVVQGGSGGDLLDLQDSANGNLLSVSTTGNIEDLGYEDSPWGGFGANQNLVLQSEAFDQSSQWPMTNITAPTANTVVAPDGTTTAEQLADTTTNANTIQTVTTSTTGNYTFSVWLKQVSGAATTGLCIFTTGGTPSSCTATAVTPNSTDWQRFSVTQNVTGSLTAVKVEILPGNGASATIDAWGAQLIPGTSAGVYGQTFLTQLIPTEGELVNGNFVDVAPNGAISQFDNFGNLSVAGQISGGNGIFNAYSSTTTALQAIQNGSGFTVPTAIINGGTSPGAGADLLQLQSNGSAVARFNNAGNLYVAGSVDTQTGTGLTIGGANATTIAIGNTSATAQTISVGTNAAANTINIGTGALSSGSDTIAIGTGSTSSGADLVTVGSANGASATTIKSGTGNLALSAAGTGQITLTTNSSSSGVLDKSATNSTTALQVQNSDGESVFQTGTTQNVDAVTNYVADSEFALGSGACPLTDWSVVGSPTSCAQNTTTANSYAADTSLKLVTTAAAGQGASTTAFTATPIAAASGLGSIWTVSFYAEQTSGTTPIIGANLTATTSGVVPTSSCVINGSAATPLITTGFEQVVCTLTYTGAGNLTGLTIETAGTVTADTIYISNVQLQEGTATTGQVTAAQIGQLSLRGVITTPLAMQNNANSSTAVQIQNAAGNTLLDVNSNNVNLNTTSVNGTTLSTVNAAKYWSVLESTNIATPGATTSYTWTNGVSPHTVGNVMVLSIGIASTTITASNITGGGVTTWHKITANAPGTTDHTELWYGVVTTAGTASVTLTFSANDTFVTEMINQEFTAGLGAGTNWAVSTSNQASNGAATTMTFPSLTSGSNGGIYVGYGDEASGNATAGTTPGFTFEPTPTNADMSLYDPSLAASTAYQPVANLSGSSVSNVVAAVLTASADDTLSTNGSTVVGGANSQSAFQVQNGAGASMLNVDSFNNIISLDAGQNGTINIWQPDTNSLPNIMATGGAVAADGYVFDEAGNDNGNVDGQVYSAKVNSDGTVGTWNTLASLPTTHVRFEATVATNGYLYELGGTNGTPTDQSTVQYAQINPNGTLGTWTTNATPLTALTSHAAAVAANGYIYVIGGNTAGGTTGSTIVYYGKVNADGSVSSWTTGGALTAADRDATAVYATGYIIVMGGGNGTTASTTVQTSSVNATTGANSAFSTTGDSVLPGARAQASAGVANGYVYVTGGRTDETTNSPQTSTYYGQLNSLGQVASWSNVSSADALQVGVFGQSMVIVDGYLIAMGGFNSSGVTTSAVYTTSTARVALNASLDLVGASSGSLADGGDQSSGSSGGSLTAGNTNIVGSLQVADQADFNQGVAVNGNLTNFGTADFKATSANALEVQNSSGSTLLNLDTTNTKVTIATTANGGELIDDGSTLDSAKSLGNLATGPIGTAAATVDTYTSFVIPQTTASVSVTVPSPTDTTAGRIIFIANTGTVPMTVGGVTLSNGSSMELFWTGSGGAWTTTAVSTGVSIIGSFSGSSQVNGASISGNTLTFGPADTTNPGMVSTGTQTFGGAKTIQVTSTGAFVVQSTGPVNMLNVDTSGEIITVGPSAGDTTGALVVFGNKTNTGDPTGIPGAMYYNSYYGKFRCFEEGTATSGVWQNCGFDGDGTFEAGLVEDDYYATTAVAPWSACAALGAGGTIATAATIAGHVGVATVSATATALTGAQCSSSSALWTFGGGETFEAIVEPLSFTNTIFRMGYSALAWTAALPSTNGCFITINGNTPSIAGECLKASVATSTGTVYTGAGLAVNTWLMLKIQINSGASSATFQAYNATTGQLLWSDSSITGANLPTVALFNGWAADNASGGAGAIYDVDEIGQYYTGYR